MLKNITLALFSAVVLLSCSSDDDTNTTPTPIEGNIEVTDYVLQQHISGRTATVYVNQLDLKNLGEDVHAVVDFFLNDGLESNQTITGVIVNMKNGEVLEGLETNRIGTEYGESVDMSKVHYTLDHIDIVYSEYKP